MKYKISELEGIHTSLIADLDLTDLPHIGHSINIVFEGIISKYRVVDVTHQQEQMTVITVEKIY